jgi:hypothetical protein
MKRHWIEFTEHWTQGPMSYWVHVPSSEKAVKYLTRALADFEGGS